MKGNPSARSRVRAAMRLRRAVLRALGGDASAELYSDLVAHGADTWADLLRMECCGTVIVARLREYQIFDRLPHSHRQSLLAASEVETQRVLAARATLAQLDRVASENGIRLTVIKGGAAVADRSLAPCDLADVDIVADRGTASELWHALQARGWVADEGIAPEESRTAYQLHFAPLRPPSIGLPLEVHPDYPGVALLQGWTPRLERLPGFASLDRLELVPSALAMLVHSVVQHPFRRGHLRDRILLAGMLSVANTEDLQAMRDSIGAHPFGWELRTEFEQALAFARGTVTADRARTEDFVAWKYAQVLRVGWPFGTRPPGWDTVSYIPLERPPVRRSAYLEQLRYAVAPVPAQSAFRFDRLRARTPIIGRFAGRVLRSGYRLALLALLASAGVVVRRVIRSLRGHVGSEQDLLSCPAYPLP
jgi:hypothetical protein